jgi:hydroxymethylpyrimidine pyrophosphatase-like HAD family hydrolase
MSGVMADKDKIEKALDNGRAAEILHSVVADEQEELKGMLKDYQKAEKLDFNFSDHDFYSLTNNFNEEIRTVMELLNKFPRKRFMFFEDALKRKAKHSNADSVPVTSIELFLIDALTDENFEKSLNNYRERKHFVISKGFHIKDLFTEADMKKAKGQHSFNILGIFVGVVAFVAITWQVLGQN